MIRIIFLVGHESFGRGLQIHNLTGAAAIFYTQLSLMYVVNMCIFALLILSGNCIAESAKQNQAQAVSDSANLSLIWC